MNSQIFGVECIVSKSNSAIVKISKLLNKKERKQAELFTLDGVKLFSEAYNFGAKIKHVILNENVDFDKEILEKIHNLKNKGTNILCVNEAVFSKLTEENAPQGIITVCQFLSNHRFNATSVRVGVDEKVMILESVRDPGNIGAIIRNAAAFGIDRLIFTSDCSDIYSQKVLRATMGAIFKVRIDIVSDLSHIIFELKAQGRRVIATTLSENSLKLRCDVITAKDVFVIGNEGHGVSLTVVEHADETLFIPMCESTESLNASVAAAIIMWELYNL